jgi:hypothetical protein
MAIRFPFVVLIFTVLLGGLIYILHLNGLVTPANEVYARFTALGLFCAGFVILCWQKGRHHRFSWDDFYKNDTLIVVSLTLLLVSLFFVQQIGFYLIGLVVVAAVVRFCYTRKFYPPPNVFYFVFLYALLMFFGTIGTQKGFHFPDRTLAFYVLPLSLCFFRLSKESLLKIANVFFKSTVVFLIICVLYWWYNFLYLDAEFFSWIFGKSSYDIETPLRNMPGLVANLRFGGDAESISYLSSHFFVSLWTYYDHSSFVSLVLFAGLTVGFFLFFQKNITMFELILCVVLCFFVVLLLQSRVGFVGTLLITIASILYYLLKKNRRLAIAFGLCVLVAGSILYAKSEKVSGYTDDKIREAYNQVAISYIKDNFWWGSGYHQQQMALEQRAEVMRETLEYPVYPPMFYVHNQFLGDMVQFGIWGLATLLLMLGAIAYYAIKNRSYLLQTMLLYAILFMTIEEPLYVQVGILRLFTFFVFFVAIAESSKPEIANLNRK